MASPDQSALLDDRELKARQRAMWALGDYHRFATESIWGFGPALVAACGIAPGQRVLDVAAGTGNVAIRAAEVGAHVIASDLTPENFDAGRREARARGVEFQWVEADAEALPFADGAFDVVTSAVGAIFAPHHQVVADELLRVCRPGGVIGMIAAAPTGGAADLFEVFERYSPPAPLGALSPLLWGQEEHVRALFGSRVESLELRRERFVIGRFPDPMALREYFKAHHPLVIALYQELADDADRVEALDHEFLEAAAHWSRCDIGGPEDYDAEFLLIVARKRRARAGRLHENGSSTLRAQAA